MNSTGTCSLSGPFATPCGIGGNGAARSSTVMAASSRTFEPELFLTSRVRTCPEGLIVKPMSTVPDSRASGLTVLVSSVFCTSLRYAKRRLASLCWGVPVNPPDTLWCLLTRRDFAGSRLFVRDGRRFDHRLRFGGLGLAFAGYSLINWERIAPRAPGIERRRARAADESEEKASVKPSKEKPGQLTKNLHNTGC